MDQARLWEAMRELLPDVTREALGAWEEFIGDRNAGDPRGRLLMRGELYAEMLHIQQDYGDDLATALFNMSGRHPVNTFELPGAAEMLESGMNEEEVFEELARCGWRPSEMHIQQIRLLTRNLL